MQNVLDTIQSIARQRGRGDAIPLILLRQLDGSAGERISHLPIEGDLAQAWLAFTGDGFRPHQSQAVTALRRGEPVALLASNPRVTRSAYLLMYALLATGRASGVLIAPDTPAAQAAYARLETINDNLPAIYRLTAHLVEPNVRPDPFAQVVITTPENLHARLLRHHDRAWNPLWPRVRMLALFDIHRYHGIAGAHLADTLLRAHRIAASHGGGVIPHILATGCEIAEPEAALEMIYTTPWRVVSGDDLPYESTVFAAWRGNSDRARESVELARSIQRQGFSVHILSQSLELSVLTPLLGDADEISVGHALHRADVLICAGYPESQSALRRMLRTGYKAVVVVLGDLPHEQMLARHTETLLSHAPSQWPAAPLNAYVTAQHLLCAATELPLTEAEVEATNLRAIVDRLVGSDQLIDLPDAEVAWKPGPAADDPYHDFSLLSASGSATIVRNEQNRAIDQLDPSGFARWNYPNAALPSGRGGLRVTTSDSETMAITVRLETNGRRSYPLRRTTVTVREERDERKLFLASRVGLGRVLVDEEIYGSREGVPGSAPSDVTLRPPQAVRWTAPCCWFELASTPQTNGQLIGWSLAAALALQTLASLTDTVPCYVPDSRRLYLVDSQPGGNGLAAWLYAHAEDVLPVAYDIALACRNDPLLEPVARADMDWLLPLLGRRGDALVLPELKPAEPAVAPKRQPAEPRQQPPPPKPVEKPVEPPRLVFLPAPEAEPEPIERDDERRPPSRQRPATEPRSTTRDTGPAAEEARPVNKEARPAPEPPRPPTKEVRPVVDEALPAAEAPRSPARESRPEADEARLTRETSRPTARETRPATEATRSTAKDRRTAREEREPEARNEPQEKVPNNTQPADAEVRPVSPDANALIERLRRQREQREAQQPAPVTQRAPTRASKVELRFKPGDRIFCLPYGDGVVRESRVEDDRELLTVHFPDYGELTIDPVVSLVRKIEDAPEDDDLL